MLKKPDSCKGCPLYGDGMGFVPDDIVEGSDVFILMQNPGDNEEQAGRPAVGLSGEYLNNHFLPLAGLSRDTVSVGNTLKCRWYNPKKKQKTNDLPSAVGVWNEEKHKWDKKKGKELEKLAVEQCMSAHLRVPKHTKLLVTLGETAAKAVTKVDRLMEWRGFLAEEKHDGVPVFIMLHPSYLLQTPRMSIPSMMDWMRVRAILSNKWPEPIPYRTIISGGDSIPSAPPGTAYITFDLEYDRHTKEPFLAGFAWFDKQGDVIGGVQVWLKEVDRYVFMWWFLRQIRAFTIVMHNCAADLEVAQLAWNISPKFFRQIEDTIQLHAVAHSEWQHDLAFCESLYGRHNKMKQLMGSNMALYNWGDCLTTGYTYYQLKQIEKTDPVSFSVYKNENMPVVAIRVESKIHGIRLDQDFLSDMSKELTECSIAAQEVAKQYAGINIGSHLQLTKVLKDKEGIKLPTNKHTGNTSIDKDILADLRRKYLDYDPEEEKDGITVEQLHANIKAGGHPLLEARACYQQSQVLHSHFIAPLLLPGIPTGRSDYAPGEFRNRCFPNQHTHSQASGRWSTVEPPLPTLKKKLRKMVIPDPGYAICGFDFDQQELRIDAHLSDDVPTIDAFTRGYDIHTFNSCDVFGIAYPDDLHDPHSSVINQQWREVNLWEGKDDRRRVFCKRFVYRVRYRGNPKYAGDIPGAKVLGLKPQDLTAASVSYLSRHPNVVRYWKVVDHNVLKTRTTRTPTGTWNGFSVGGRKRYLNGFSAKSGMGEVPAICREGTNHPMQGFGADALYVSVQAIYHATRDLKVFWAYGAHDSQKWLVPSEHVPVFQERILEIMDSPWKVNGTDLYLPITLDKPTYAKGE